MSACSPGRSTWRVLDCWCRAGRAGALAAPGGDSGGGPARPRPRPGHTKGGGPARPRPPRPHERPRPCAAPAAPRRRLRRRPCAAPATLRGPGRTKKPTRRAQNREWALMSLRRTFAPLRAVARREWAIIAAPRERPRGAEGHPQRADGRPNRRYAPATPNRAGGGSATFCVGPSPDCWAASASARL